MDFSNQNISVEELPSIEDVAFHPLEKSYLKVSRISFILSGVIVLLIGATIFYFVDELQSLAIIISASTAFILLSVLGWILETISFKFSGYALRERDILFRRGWLIRRMRVVPLKRVQHVSVQSGPIERRFGLASISIFTAGSDAADFTIKGVATKTAQDIKEWISIKINGELN